MKKRQLDFYKPMTRNGEPSGTALQVNTSDAGLNIQMAKQKTLKQGNYNASFGWKELSFSATLKAEEQTQVLNAFEKIKKMFEHKRLINELNNDVFKLKDNNGQPLNFGVKNESVKALTVKLQHMASKTPKVVTFEFNEYPVGSGCISLGISINGTAASFDDQRKTYVMVDKQYMNIKLKEEETISLMKVFENEVSTQLDSSLISSILVNISEQDPKGHCGFKTMSDVKLPNLTTGETITFNDNKKFIIKKKEFLLKESKPIYFCEVER